MRMGGLRLVRMKVAERDGGAPSAPAEPYVYRQPPRRGKPPTRSADHTAKRRKLGAQAGRRTQKNPPKRVERAGKAAVPPLPYPRMARMAPMDREAADGLKSADGENPSG